MKKLFVATLLLGTTAFAQDQLPGSEQTNFDSSVNEPVSKDATECSACTVSDIQDCRSCSEPKAIDVNDPAYVACIAAYLQRTIQDWSSLSPEAQQKNITEYQEDELTFNELVAILRDANLEDAVKLEKFEATFNKLHNKNHNAEGGTILAAIVGFTQDALLEALVKTVTEQGVTTNRLPGEFSRNRYFADKKPMTAVVADQAQDTYDQIKQTVSDLTEKVSDLTEKVTEKVKGTVDKVTDKLGIRSTAADTSDDITPKAAEVIDKEAAPAATE